MGKERQKHLGFEPEPQKRRRERPPLNPRAHLKEDLARTMEASRHSRPQIVDRMNAAFKLAELPNRVSLAKLDAWAAKSKSALPTLLEAEYFYWAAEGWLPLAGQAERAGFMLVDAADRKFLDLGKTEHSLRRLGQRARRLRQEIEDGQK